MAMRQAKRQVSKPAKIAKDNISRVAIGELGIEMGVVQVNAC